MALYLAFSSVFVAQAFEIRLSLSSQLAIGAGAGLLSMFQLSLTARRLAALSYLVVAVGLPPVATAIVTRMDPLFGLLGSLMDVASAATAAVLVARLSSEKLGGDPQ